MSICDSGMESKVKTGEITVEVTEKPSSGYISFDFTMATAIQNHPARP